MAVVAAFLDPVEERLWRSRGSVSVCVAVSFLILITATAIVNATARHSDAAARAKPPVRTLGWPNPRTVATFVTPCMWRAYRRGAPHIPVMAVASRATGLRYKIP